MPLYEYRCKQCKKSFEVLQKINSDPLEHCLHCNGKVEKLISVSSFQLKGSGWYITDYKNKGSKSGPKPAPAASPEKEQKDKNVTLK
jgi:putative FmdB family regulatory protein